MIRSKLFYRNRTAKYRAGKGKGGTGMQSKRAVMAIVLAVTLMFSTVVLIAFAGHGPPGSHLVAVGPIDPAHGFPLWYKDANGLTLELCIDVQDPLCNFIPALDLPDPDSPVSFPDNFPVEAFWWSADALMSTNNGGRALLVLAMEAAFGGLGEVTEGQQITFGRIRIRIDNLAPGETYTVTHPFGVEVFQDVPAGPNGIRFTEDIGGGPGDFTMALDSRIGPFLTWDPITDAPAGYVGDPLFEHPVTGSPFGTNFFRIEGLNVGDPGSPFLCSDPTLGPDPVATTDCIETDLFIVTGKIATRFGVGVNRATYYRSASGLGSIDVFAFSEVGQVIRVKGSGISTTEMDGDTNGRYFARIEYSSGSGPPASITLKNVSDNPPFAVTVSVTDLVTITRAIYDTVTNELAIEAQSSDMGSPPTLTAVGFGPLTPVGTTAVYSSVFGSVIAPPAEVTVESSAGGSDTVSVIIVGAGFPPMPVVADAGLDQTVLQGQQVSLDGTNSDGDITGYNWVQIAGTSVSLTGANTVTPSFTAPLVVDTLTFELTVTGPGGPSTDTVDVFVLPVSPPVANAGPDQDVVQGSLVTLDGTNSTGALTFNWTQVGGTPVTLDDPTSPTPTFTFPSVADTLTFELTVTGPGGSDTDTVLVTAIDDVLTITDAQFRESKGQWIIVGTATVLGPPELGVGGGPGNTITIHIGPTLAGPVLGTAEVDDLGDWVFKVRNSPLDPDVTETVSIESSAGGQLLGFPLTIKP